MNYTLHQLQVFLRVVHTKSITRASEELYMTQPAVSIQLKNFQDQFEIPLTEVIGRQLQITDFGQEIAAMAERVLNEVQAINNRTQTYKGLLAGRLKIASVSTGKYVMPYFLSPFLAQHPGIELMLDVTNKQRVTESLENGEVDFALVSVLPKAEVEEEKLLENWLCLVGNKTTKWPAAKQSVSILRDMPLIYREPGSATRMVMETFLENKKLKERKRLELTSNEAVKQAVIAGLGYSVMPLIGLRNELRSGELQLIPVNGLPLRSDWRLIWLKKKKLPPAALAYLEFLRAEKLKIRRDAFGWATRKPM
ncbi:MAG: LysR family transcriptional regulator [Bacteroidia bacterium]|jgi:DNA-binding transcriptional LysR family regulator|nr:LysR family transcriptional regulator [Bacteroidia bacterium]